MSRCILGKDFGNQKHLIPSSNNRFAYDFLNSASSVHFCGIDVRHTAFNPSPQRGDGGVAILSFEIPGALSDYRNIALCRIEETPLHLLTCYKQDTCSLQHVLGTLRTPDPNRYKASALEFSRGSRAVRPR